MLFSRRSFATRAGAAALALATSLLAREASADPPSGTRTDAERVYDPRDAGLTQLMKLAVQRPAPLVYDESVPLEERESRDGARSFWSGHTATAFSAATTHADTYWLRHPRDPWRFTVLAADMTAAAAVGLLESEAGYHYPTDVAAGALVGTSIGILVPMLHRRF